MIPILGITMGDICGIGPEITAKALEEQHIYKICKPVVIGNAEVLKKAINIVGADLKVHPISAIKDAKFTYGTIDVYDLPLELTGDIPYGVVSKEGGESAYQAISKAISLAMNNEIDGTVTGPLNKEALHLAGHMYSGHTEIYADLTHTKGVSMMLVHDDLRVVHVSTHVSLREACDRAKKERILQVIRLAYESCRNLGIENPNIGVAGLNPHSGENGLFGREEIEEITPAILQAREEGINVDGPVPPDTIFSKALGGQYDIVVAMYHDQGHIPLKVIGFRMDKGTGQWLSVSGVNITLGLPIIRSSVDHGTAFDQAGKGTATADSMVNSLEYGARLAQVRIQKREENHE